MKSFTTLTSRLVPLPNRDVDTDQIIPARYLKVTDKSGLAEGLFAGWRFDQDGSPNPSFGLNRPECAQAQVLLAGDNFGCGSSREHAVWALAAAGFRAVISTSFADIFRSNALKNGLLPVAIEVDGLERLFAQVRANPWLEVTVDLPSQTLQLPDGAAYQFPIDPFSKLCLLEGVDPLGYLLNQEASILEYERQAQN